MEPKISVIVPVYNVEEYLEKCIVSILEQTVHELEIILINDGSTDRSGEICDQYKTQDDRIIVIHNKNQGISEARNCGLDIAKGEFIGFVDSDDWLDKDMFETLLGGYEQARIDIVQCGARQIYKDEIIETRNERQVMLNSRQALSDHIENVQISASVWNKLFRHELIRDIRFQAGKVHEDYYFLYRAMLKANAIQLLNSCKYNHIHTNMNSITKVKFNIRAFDKVDAFQERMEYLYQIGENELAEKAAKEYYKLAMDYYFRCIENGMKDGAERLQNVIANNREDVLRLQKNSLEKVRANLFLSNPILHNKMLKLYHRSKGIK